MPYETYGSYGSIPTPEQRRKRLLAAGQSPLPAMPWYVPLDPDEPPRTLQRGQGPFAEGYETSDMGLPIIDDPRLKDSSYGGVPIGLDPQEASRAGRDAAIVDAQYRFHNPPDVPDYGGGGLGQIPAPMAPLTPRQQAMERQLAGLDANAARLKQQTASRAAEELARQQQLQQSGSLRGRQSRYIMPIDQQPPVGGYGAGRVPGSPAPVQEPADYGREIDAAVASRRPLGIPGGAGGADGSYPLIGARDEDLAAAGRVRQPISRLSMPTPYVPPGASWSPGEHAAYGGYEGHKYRGSVAGMNLSAGDFTNMVNANQDHPTPGRVAGTPPVAQGAPGDVGPVRSVGPVGPNSGVPRGTRPTIADAAKYEEHQEYMANRKAQRGAATLPWEARQEMVGSRTAGIPKNREQAQYAADIRTTGKSTDAMREMALGLDAGPGPEEREATFAGYKEMQRSKDINTVLASSKPGDPAHTAALKMLADNLKGLPGGLSAPTENRAAERRAAMEGKATPKEAEAAGAAYDVTHPLPTVTPPSASWGNAFINGLALTTAIEDTGNLPLPQRIAYLKSKGYTIQHVKDFQDQHWLGSNRPFDATARRRNRALAQEMLNHPKLWDEAIAPPAPPPAIPPGPAPQMRTPPAAVAKGKIPRKGW